MLLLVIAIVASVAGALWWDFHASLPPTDDVDDWDVTADWRRIR